MTLRRDFCCMYFLRVLEVILRHVALSILNMIYYWITCIHSNMCVHDPCLFLQLCCTATRCGWSVGLSVVLFCMTTRWTTRRAFEVSFTVPWSTVADLLRAGKWSVVQGWVLEYFTIWLGISLEPRQSQLATIFHFGNSLPILNDVSLSAICSQALLLQLQRLE